MLVAILDGRIATTAGRAQLGGGGAPHCKTRRSVAANPPKGHFASLEMLTPSQQLPSLKSRLQFTTLGPKLLKFGGNSLKISKRKFSCWCELCY